MAVGLLAAVPAAPQWESDYGKALKATRAGDRPLLVVLDQPKEPQNPVKPVAFTEEAAISREAELLAPYHLCHVDVSTEYGKQVAKAFGATSFPYTAIIDRTGSVIIFAKTGKIEVKEWEDTLLSYREGDRSETLVLTSNERTSTVILRKSSDLTLDPSCPSCQRGYCPSCQQGN
jgi:hypothetical protein